MTRDPLFFELTSPIPLALSTRDAATALSVSPDTLKGLMARGEVPHVRIGRRVLYPVAELRAWLSAKAAADQGGDA